MSFIKNLLKPILNGYQQRPRYQRMLIILSAIYFSFTALLGLLVPYLVVKQVPKQLSELLQRPVTLEQVKINPFTLEVAIDNFELHETNNQPFIGFKQLTFEYQFWDSIFNGAFSVADITLSNPAINVERIKSPQTLRFNFSDIISTLASRTKEKTSEESTKTTVIPHFIISNLAIVNADLSFIDQVTNSQLHYSDLNLNVKFFDSEYAIKTALENLGDQQKTNHYSMNVVGRQGGKIATQGLVQLAPLNIVGDVQLNDIRLPQFWSFISEHFAPDLTSGRLSLSSNYQLQMQDDKLEVTTDLGLVKLDDINFDYQKQSIIKLPMIALKGIAFNLQQQTVTAETLDTNGLVLNAKINKDGVNLATLFTPLGESGAPAHKANTTPTTQAATDTSDNQGQEQSKTSWTAVLKGINLKDYQVNLTEQLVTKNTLWQIDDIELITGAIEASLAKPIDYQLSLNINQKGVVKSSGSIDTLKQLVSAKVSVAEFALPQIRDYLKPYVNIELKQGDFNTQGELVIDAKTEQLSYIGNLAINDLLIKDTVQKKELLKWKALEVNHLAFDKLDSRLEIDHVTLNQPYGRIIIAKDKSTNIGDLIVKSAADPKEQKSKAVTARVSTKQISENVQAQAQKPAAKPLALTINKITFKQGSTFFADNSLTPNFAASIVHLDGQISKLSSNSKQTASVDITGKIDRYAPVTLKGDINPLLEQPYLDLDLSFKHLELTSVNPYSGTYAGYYIDKGLLSLDLNYKLDNSQLVGENHLVIDQLKLGKPSDSSLATTLPVTLAIALLQDRHGVIDLGLQVSGDVDDPSFSIGSIVMTAFTNVITKAVTAPFSLLANLLGANEGELDKINFAAGSATLDGTEQETLDKLAKGLNDRPMLTLNIEGGVNMLKDSHALSEQQLKRKIAQTAKLDLTALPAVLSPSSFPTSGPLSDALIKLYETEFSSSAQAIKDKIAAEHQGKEKLTDEQLSQRWHIALYNFTLGAQRVTEEALGKLAQTRATAVKSYLIEKEHIAPQRIFLLDSRVELNTGASQALLTLSAAK
ncbi:DUF748 domain-containing protein [Shewanella schlegeliana]|uniref:DUF748 domain-containing protein n=1 Tax=Shewanella schlegeliana TaxID=190308 RepID=A0ABS1STD9_9GAMM|nr:DUF748 domain-containing protein [Shewanella schlegeliana]MBL4911804.1 DUF748 domain-containing protein [Shewanella schlegeliana]MCL1110242.1 DUF748 domain-containing protein [Shewanella schlegeliana]GIU35828.1 hypothetical protein TUM4433_33740 [Shewanella schlegeliana]